MNCKRLQEFCVADSFALPLAVGRGFPREVDLGVRMKKRLSKGDLRVKDCFRVMQGCFECFPVLGFLGVYGRGFGGFRDQYRV